MNEILPEVTVRLKTIKTYLTKKSMFANSKGEQVWSSIFKFTEKKEKGYHEVWVEIVEGGVTGYESFIFGEIRDGKFSYKDDAVKRMTKKGWCACAGTEGRWDRLDVPAESCAKLFETFNLLWEGASHVLNDKLDRQRNKTD